MINKRSNTAVKMKFKEPGEEPGSVFGKVRLPFISIIIK